MKRLVTIILTSIIGFTLYGQIPMTVVGDVYIDDTGIMKSVGPVHLKANSEVAVARVANHGNLVMDAAAHFYTNNINEGLLMNQTPNPNQVRAQSVSVRKNFPVDYVWYEIAFPFKVDLENGVRNSAGTKLTYANDFYIAYYDAQKRADSGKNEPVNWVNLDFTTTKKLEKGIGYRVAVKWDNLSGDKNVDFFAMDEDIQNLFDRKAKDIELTFKVSPIGKFDTNYSEGWNAIGGLNSTNYLMNSSTINYPNAIYYIEQPDPFDTYADNNLWKQLNPAANTGTLRPYAVIFVQTNNTTNLIPATGGGFQYFGNGAGLTLVHTGPLFRSSVASTHDLLELQLTKDVDGKSHSSETYFKLNDSYSKDFNSSEGDAFALQITSTIEPIVWSVAQSFSLKKETPDKLVNNITFINCLPYHGKEIPIGVNIPNPGKYTFSLREVAIGQGIESAILWDKEKQIETDLLKSDYDFYAEYNFNTEGRFALFLNKSQTTIEQLTTKEIYAYTENNVLTVINLNAGDKVQVLDMSGRTVASGVASGNTYSVNLNQKGVYIVNARGEKTLKVLNK